MNKIKIANSLQLSEERLNTCLLTIKEHVTKFWNPIVLHQHYTNHGLEHSARIIEKIEDILKLNPNLLNKYERFILLASVYLHDIGMQSPIDAGLTSKEKYTYDELEIIRKRHHESSASLIKRSILKDSKISLGLELCKEFADFIADVSKFHRKIPIKQLKNTSIAQNSLNLQLLAGILRLCDELDKDYRRVNMEILRLTNIPIISKFHWWSHHYVQDVKISNGLINLYFRFPSEFEGKEMEKIFINRIEASIREQINDVYSILFENNIKLHKDFIEIKEVRYDSSVFPIPNDLLDHIETIIKLSDQTKLLEGKTGCIWFVDGLPYSDNEEIIKITKKVYELLYNENNKEAMNEIRKGLLLTMSPRDRMIFLFLAGNCSYILGSLQESKAYYNDALDILDRSDFRKTHEFLSTISRASILGNLGNVYKAQGKIEDSLACFNESLNLAKSGGFKTVEANQFGNIGLIHATKGDNQKAEVFLTDSLLLHRKNNDSIGEAASLVNLGIIYQKRGDLDRALQYQHNALKIDREVGYKQGEISDLGNLGILHKKNNELNQAFEYFQRALKISKEIGWKSGEVKSLANIANLYLEKNDFDNALIYFLNGLEIAKEIGDKQSESMILGNISLIHLDKGDISNALREVEEALQTSKEIGSKEDIARHESNIGLIYSMKNEFFTALEYHENALKLNQEIGNRESEANQRICIGIIYTANGSYNLAMNYFKKAHLIYKEIGDKGGEAESLMHFGILYKQIGDYNRGLRVLKEALEIMLEYDIKKGRELVRKYIKELDS